MYNIFSDTSRVQFTRRCIGQWTEPALKKIHFRETETQSEHEERLLLCKGMQI